MSAYAIYRLPHEDHATLIRQTEGNPVELHSLTELNGKQGFVVAPFEVKSETPILLIRPDEVEEIEVKDVLTEYPLTSTPSPLTTYYKVDFANYHSQLKNDTFRKIVLARCADEKIDQKLEPMELFYRACAMYPRLFIALVETEKATTGEP